MATILTKRSNTASSVPVAGDLTNSTGGAELAVNTADKRLFTKDSGGTVVELGTNPSSVTLPNGTANGVPYLNGSKVLTSGSALTFDGTIFSLGSGGSGTIATVLSINATDNAGQGGYILGKRNGSNAWFIGDTAGALGSGTGLISYNYGTAPWIWYLQTGGEQMRLTSTGLGIGTSSPTAKLTVNGQARIQQSGTDQLRFYTDATTAYIDSVNNSDMRIGPAGAYPLRFAINGSEVARLDSSGNLGLGVTPSAWSTATGTQALQIGSGGVSIYGTGSGWSSAAYMYLSNNAYYSSGAWRYLRSVESAQYVQVAGAHQWLTAPSGTAGNAISFTQAMTLDASGNLGIGTSSPATKADVAGTIRTTSGSDYGTFTCLYDGNLASYQIAFRTGLNNARTERARIDSDGNLLVGINTQLRSGDRVSVVGTGTQVMSLRNDTNASGYSTYSSILQQNANNTSTYHFWGNTNAVGNWYLYGNGTTSFSSDARLKKNIETTRDGYIEDLCKLRVVKYNWKNDADGSPKELGLIAQEVEQVFPGLVQDDLNPVEDGGEIYKQVKQSVLPFMLIKAIQEQQAIINQLKARLDAANL